MSLLSDICDEYVTYLSGQTYSQSITFSAQIVSRLKLEDMGSEITGIVFPTSMDRVRENRGPIRSLYTITLAITKKTQTNTDDETYTLIDLVEEICESLDNIATTSSRSMSVNVSPIYDFDRMNENGIFSSFIQIEARARH